jgi:crotonobetaine/carnitine-CoA ligase
VTSNLAELLTARAVDRPDLRIGMVDAQMDLADAVQQAAGGARVIREAGVGDGDRVAVVASNSSDYIVTKIACVLASIPVALINPTYLPELLRRMLGTFEPALAFTDLPADDLAGVATQVPLSSWSQWKPSDPLASPGLSADPLHVVSFMHTSGTTGIPKF